MKAYKKHILFFIAFFLFTIIVAGIRLHWIQKALPSTATVLYIDQTRFTKLTQYFPVVSYQTLSGSITTRGTYNLPINAGDTVSILYNPDDMKDFKLNNTYWLWYDIWSWYRVILVAIAIYYLVLLIVKKTRDRTQPHIVKNARYTEQLESWVDSKDPSISIEIPIGNRTELKRSGVWFPRVLKITLILVLPIIIFIIGHIWDLTYLKEAAVVLLFGLIALGMPSGSASDSDL